MDQQHIPPHMMPPAHHQSMAMPPAHHPGMPMPSAHHPGMAMPPAHHPLHGHGMPPLGGPLGHPPQPPPPPISHGYGMEMPSDMLSRSSPAYNGRSNYRDRSFSPRRRTPSPPRGGYRDSRGYDRGYDRSYDRSYDRGSYDRGYSSRSGYDRSGYSSYDRGYDRYDRGGYDRRYDDRSYGRSYSRPRSPPPKRARTINRGSEDDRKASKTLYVGNLPYSFLEPEVQAMFGKFGTIVKITIVLDQFTGRNKGFAFVEYEDRKHAEEAMDKYNGFDVEGRRLKLDWDIGLVKKDIKPRVKKEEEQQHQHQQQNNVEDNTLNGQQNQSASSELALPGASSTPSEQDRSLTASPTNAFVAPEPSNPPEEPASTGEDLNENQKEELHNTIRSELAESHGQEQDAEQV